MSDALATNVCRHRHRNCSGRIARLTTRHRDPAIAGRSGPTAAGERGDVDGQPAAAVRDRVRRPAQRERARRGRLGHRRSLSADDDGARTRGWHRIDRNGVGERRSALAIVIAGNRDPGRVGRHRPRAIPVGGDRQRPGTAGGSERRWGSAHADTASIGAGSGQRCFRFGTRREKNCRCRDRKGNRAKYTAAFGGHFCRCRKWFAKRRTVPSRDALCAFSATQLDRFRRYASDGVRSAAG